MKKYEQRGVSATKSEVHKAIKNLDKGLFPNAFCKILPDFAGGDNDFCNIMHADTAGTKTSLAYVYWKETGDADIWKGIVQDSLIMNLDDMACAGVTDNFIISSTIGRNKNLVTAPVLEALISGTTEFIESLKNYGINIHHAGGETADVGDIVRTADVGFTVFARLPKNEVVNINIKPGDVIIGVASYGQAIYENFYNSGIGSNGLTFARHEVLNSAYAEKYPESFDPNLPPDVVYTGKLNVTDNYNGTEAGKLLLSPTRTYLPVIKEVLKNYRSNLNGLIHCTGGGLTKVLHFIDDLHIIKDNPLPVPDVFKMIQEQSNADWKEMYQVFNMGQRLEIYLPEEFAGDVMQIINSFGMKTQIIGRCHAAEGKKVTVKTQYGDFEFNK